MSPDINSLQVSTEEGTTQPNEPNPGTAEAETAAPDTPDITGTSSTTESTPAPFVLDDTSTTPRAAGEPQTTMLLEATSKPSGKRSTTWSSRTGGADTYEMREKKERDAIMMRMLQKAKTPKKLAFPSKYPAYLKEPPSLGFEETNASIRRRLYNEKRLKEMSQPVKMKRDERKLTFMSPKANKTLKLRSLYIKREPLVSQYFSDHYNKYRKPPFKNTNVRLHHKC